MSAPATWLEPLRRELTAASRPVTFFFRDDDAGWDDGGLLALLDLFAAYAVPIDLAVIPTALGPELASELRRRSAGGLVDLHQHGYAHANHEPEGRPCEFGPSRRAAAQRRDLEAGARRLRKLLGPAVAPIFTPPWNRCTEVTGRCLRELGFRALSRDSTAAPLGIAGLHELRVDVDWLGRTKGVRLSLRELGERLAAAALAGSVGVMLHHALIGRDERKAVEELLALVTSHPNARCRTMVSLLGESGRVSRRAARAPARATPPAGAGRATPRT